MFFDKFAIFFEPMEEQLVQDLTWHGLSIPELAPKITTSSQPQRDVNGKGVMDGVVPNSSKVASSRARTQSVGRPLIPNATTIRL